LLRLRHGSDMERSAGGRNNVINVAHISQRLKTHLFRQPNPDIVG